MVGYLVYFSAFLITIQTSQSRQYLENYSVMHLQMTNRKQFGMDRRLVDRTNTSPESVSQEDLLPQAGLPTRQPTPGQARLHSSTDRCVCLSSLKMRNCVQPFTRATATALQSRWTHDPYSCRLIIAAGETGECMRVSDKKKPSRSIVVGVEALSRPGMIVSRRSRVGSSALCGMDSVLSINCGPGTTGSIQTAGLCVSSRTLWCFGCGRWQDVGENVHSRCRSLICTLSTTSCAPEVSAQPFISMS